MLVPLAMVAFWPTPVDQPVQGELAGFLILIQALGIPRWVNYSLIEASANIVLFVPVGLVVSQAFPSKRIWRLGAFGLVVSSCMELGQQLLLHDRFASPLDLVTNAAGCVIGALAARVSVRELKRRQAHRQLTMSLPKNSL
ncbi:glycopeptide antibiotics resistance protein [Arthrobacter sp. PvP102]|uniref:VanZ family protein n=1 Tax=unclassified Arthrobacter TaxID=235627 RepID=UPI001AE12C9C|nr:MULTISPECIES: VanZ family protein [unclassified Arthrobacter]MBP1232525.1 glycopeptide antibiotics resistance protein [Arthrobacter sp. PvP103]MBP1237660.1 glycopeptide antibiotics resistance protein [Arthrobacter sp. PvP102]